jgi:adenosylhomocysteine nucleosidase
MPRIAIVSAMAEELGELKIHLSGAACVPRAGRQFWTGRLGEHDAVLVLSGIGKVAAATTAAVLLSAFQVDRLLFTGVAGGLGPARVGDLVVADHLVQHDMDASPLFPRHEVPLYGLSRFPSDAPLSDRVQAAAEALWRRPDSGDASPTDTVRRSDLAAFGLPDTPRVHRGLVLTGDRFVCSAAASRQLTESFPDALAVEMEGAAVSQVCKDFGVPFAVLRVVSDRADDAAHVDFNRFIQQIASRYTAGVVRALLLSPSLPSLLPR